MERAHVVIRLREAAEAAGGGGATGIHRTSETTVRLEHSEMSPGVASITFEQVYDQQHSNAHIFQHTLARSVQRAVDGYPMTVVATGAPQSGKSFTCHGRKDRAQTEPGADDSAALSLEFRTLRIELESAGIVTLSIREVFDAVEQRKDAAPGATYQVLLSCLHVVNDQVVDLTTDGAIDALVPSEMMEQTLTDRSVRVESAAEAVHLYSQARIKSLASYQEKTNAGDFVVTLFIESQQSFERPRRGRIIFLDICGSSIIEPRTLQITNQDDPINDASSPGKPYFSDTHFPVHSVLSRHFGTFLGNSSTTFMLVMIQKPAQFQQQAIQSLLYACKAKDIRSTCTIHYLSVITTLQSPETNEHDRYHISESSCGSEDNADALSSPVSLTSSESTSEITVDSQQTVGINSETAIGNHFEISKTHLKVKQEMLAQRLRKAYETAKASSQKTTPGHDPADVQINHFTEDESVQTTTVSALHTKADLILKKLLHSPNSMTLPEKLELIHTHAQELEQSLVHETSIKNKCVDRISKLSQTMSFQVIEHEKQITCVLEEKKQIENRLREMEHKYADVGDEIDSLRSQVNEMRTASVQSSMPSVITAITDQERLILQQFSSRLESTIQEAKIVVDFKDSVIKEVESRLALSNQVNERLECELARVQSRLEEEKRSLLVQIRGLERKMTLEEEHAKNVCEDWDAEKATLLAKIAQLTLDLENQSRNWQVREASYQAALESEKNNAVNRSLASYDDVEKAKLEQQLLARTAECAFSQAACKARGRQIERMEFQEERLTTKLVKQKKKMEKKLRLLLNDRKQHRIDSSNQLETAQESARELSVLQDQVRYYGEQEVIWGRKTQDFESRLRDLQQQCQGLEHVNSGLRIKIDSLVDDKQRLQDERSLVESKFEQQMYELEQSIGRKLVEKEAQIVRENERKMRKLKKRHSAEMLRRDMEVSEQGIHRRSSSSSSSPESPVKSYSQTSIDQLEAFAGANNTSLTCGSSSAQTLKKRLAQQEQQVQALDQRAAALTHALALANEQETRAKQQMQQCKVEYEHSLEARDELLQEVNHLKQENWSLNLALQVTERQRK